MWVFDPFFSIQCLVLFCFAIISPGNRAGCFTLIALWCHVKISVCVPSSWSCGLVGCFRVKLTFMWIMATLEASDSEHFFPLAVISSSVDAFSPVFMFSRLVEFRVWNGFIIIYNVLPICSFYYANCFIFLQKQVKNLHCTLCISSIWTVPFICSMMAVS